MLRLLVKFIQKSHKILPVAIFFFPGLLPFLVLAVINWKIFVTLRNLKKRLNVRQRLEMFEH